MEKAITTDSGFEVRVDEEAVDDVRLFDLTFRHDSGDRQEQISTITPIIALLIGEEQKDALYAYLEGKEGRPKIQTLENDICGIFRDLSGHKKK